MGVPPPGLSRARKTDPSVAGATLLAVGDRRYPGEARSGSEASTDLYFL